MFRFPIQTHLDFVLVRVCVLENAFIHYVLLLCRMQYTHDLNMSSTCTKENSHPKYPCRTLSLSIQDLNDIY